MHDTTSDTRHLYRCGEKAIGWATTMTLRDKMQKNFKNTSRQTKKKDKKNPVCVH